MYGGYLLFGLFVLIWLGGGVIWVTVLVYSLVRQNKRLTRWLVVLGLIGIAPLPIYMVHYTISYFHWHPTVATVSGKYQGSFSGEKDTLVLRLDGTFSQQFVPSQGQAYTRTGQWTLEAVGFAMFDLDAQDTVNLDKLVVQVSGTGKHQKPQFNDHFWQPVDESSICFGGEDTSGVCFTR